MLETLKRFFSLGEYARNFGSIRSNQWPAVRNAHIQANPTCANCGGTKKLNVHHINPFHINPALELDSSNLITLCEGNPTVNCHLRFGHFDNFRTKWNPDIITESQLWLKRFNAKSEDELLTK